MSPKFQPSETPRSPLSNRTLDARSSRPHAHQKHLLHILPRLAILLTSLRTPSGVAQPTALCGVFLCHECHS